MNSHQQKARDKSIADIKTTALRLFSTKGYNATSIRQIAKDTDISLGLLYNYFPSKQALLQAIFHQGMSDIQTSFNIEAEDDPKERLASYFRKIFGMLQEKQAFWRLMHSIRMQSDIMTLLATESQFIQQFIVQQLTAFLEDIQHPQPSIEAVLLFATIDGICNHYLIVDAYPIDKMCQLLIERYT